MDCIIIQAKVTIGTSIQKAALEACKLSDQLQARIEFNFNGCTCHILPGGDPFKLVERYQEDCKREKPTNYISNR